MLELIVGLAREIRCCSREEAFCEGVTFQQFVILDTVANKKEMLLSELHGVLSVEKSTTTRLVDPLVRKGFLKRESALHDSRAVKLVMTDEGMEVHARVWACLCGFFQRVLMNIPKAERNNLFISVKAFTGAMRGVLEENSCCASGKRSKKNG